MTLRVLKFNNNEYGKSRRGEQKAGLLARERHFGGCWNEGDTTKEQEHEGCKLERLTQIKNQK